MWVAGEPAVASGDADFALELPRQTPVSDFEIVIHDEVAAERKHVFQRRRQGADGELSRDAQGPADCPGGRVHDSESSLAQVAGYLEPLQRGGRWRSWSGN